MPWHAHLQLDYRREGDRTRVFDRHDGPLRVLASLRPEGPSVCHNVVVHPPGGIVGGDVLELTTTLAPNTHALITTPGATRFYRSAGDLAQQRVSAQVAMGARLEWLPQETVCRRSALAHNSARFELAPGAEMIGWDLLSLGLPASGEHFDDGRLTQTIELPSVWLEHAVIDGRDRTLLDSPLGWAGHRVLGTLWFAAGAALVPARREALLDAARQVCNDSPLQRTAGTTAPQAKLVVLRVLAPKVEPAQRLLRSVWAAWRSAAWQLDAVAPRVWST
jgi:urease accessory protein